MPILIFFLCSWYLSLFLQTFFQHRYAAHAAFHMSKRWEKVFFILAYITQGSSYLSPRAYAVMHRMHHAFTDTEDDPHSPSYQSNFFSMMWRTRNYYAGIFDGSLPVEARFTKNVPDWPAFDRWANSALSRLIWMGLYTAFFVVYATSPWQYLLLPLIFAMCPLHGVIINWYAHKYGYINFRLRNTSKNLFHVDVLMLGEAYHNNHHKNPSAINFGKRSHELDPIYPVILLFKKLGIIQIAKPVPVAVNEGQAREIKPNEVQAPTFTDSE